MSGRRRNHRRSNRRPRPQLTIPEILGWADEWFARTGRWPTLDSGRIGQPHVTTWRALSMALRMGFRGLPGGSSLARLLLIERGVGRPQDSFDLSTPRILAWADEFFSRTESWPKANSGRIPQTSATTWCGVDSALRIGGRGLPGGSSLAQLLHMHRAVRNIMDLPDLTSHMILAWADAYRAHHGTWPDASSGDIPDSGGETWRVVSDCLLQGKRGCPPGSSLPKLLAEHRGQRNHMALRHYDVAEILAWADCYFERIGRWPNHKAGAIAETPGETWRKVDTALRMGLRGLPGGSSLSQLIAERRDIRCSV